MCVYDVRSDGQLTLTCPARDPRYRQLHTRPTILHALLTTSFVIVQRSASPLRLGRTTLLRCGLVLSAACGDALAPFEPEVASPADNFQLQATGVVNVTSARTYTWANSGSRATVNHSTTVTAGTAQLIIRDAAGTVVYDRALAPSLNEPTSAGMAGTWSIQLRLTGYSGTLNFRAQKR